MKYKTAQEDFWAGKFGCEYIGRNSDRQLLASNLHFFSSIFSNMEKPRSIIEFGANIGMNLKAIQLLFPDISSFGIEINNDASKELIKLLGESNVFNGSIFDFQPQNQYDISLIKGVLIHINPDFLNIVYDNLYKTSKKYILICEYYNPSPVAITYRGEEGRLFKRDFAGEMLKKYDDLSLVDYGFVYKGDNSFPQDDITWFLLKKTVI